MKLYNIDESNIDDFFKAIDECKGKVEIVSDDFRLNLKSKFAQYVSIAKIFFNKEVEEIELIAYNQDDVNRLMNFMVNAKTI